MSLPSVPKPKPSPPVLNRPNLSIAPAVFPLNAVLNEVHEIRSGGRILKFEGTLISRVSSERSNAPRWTILELYRTVRELYVVHRTGMTLVFHTSDCQMAQQNRLQYGHELSPVPTLQHVQSLAGCQLCRPHSTDPLTQLRFEVTRHWASIAETPDSVVDLLHKNHDGHRSLPWISAALLDLAAKNDAGIAKAYGIEQL